MSDTQTAWARYNATESSIHAWVEVNPQASTGSGPLDGIPFGVKDIIETAGLATEYGSPLYAGRKGTGEAAIVTRLREQGAILFGKTHTTAFAYFDPAPTRNPHDGGHTPGGSSSGSAAAVAAGVVPFAIGTQTMGSIVRPASFCGVTGFKPTFGALPREGVLPFAPSLDTVGLLAANVKICRDVWQALGFGVDNGGRLSFAVPANLPEVSGEMKTAFSNVLDLLGREYEVKPVSLPAPYEALLSAARFVNDYEGARTHRERHRQFGDRIGAKLAALVERGLQLREGDYRDSLLLLKTAAASLQRVFEQTPVLLTPSALGEAPGGLASTGDPAMNAVWTALGTPVIGIPMPHPGKLPLGLQMISALHGDAMLLNAALTVEELFTR